MRSFFRANWRFIVSAAMLPVESLTGQGADGDRAGRGIRLSGMSVAGSHRSRSRRHRSAACRMDHSLGAKGESLDRLLSESLDRLLSERSDFLHQFVQERVPGRRSDPMYFPAAELRRIRCTARRAVRER